MKRFWSSFLAMLLVCALLTGALADDGADAGQEVYAEQEVTAAPVDDNGSSGDSADLSSLLDSVDLNDLTNQNDLSNEPMLMNRSLSAPAIRDHQSGHLHRDDHKGYSDPSEAQHSRTGQNGKKQHMSCGPKKAFLESGPF